MFKVMVFVPLISSAPIADKTVFVSAPINIEEGNVGVIELFSLTPIKENFKIILPFKEELDTFNFSVKDSFNQSRIIPVPAKTSNDFFVVKIFNSTDTILRVIWIVKKDWPSVRWSIQKPKKTEVSQPVDSIYFWVNSFPSDTIPFVGELSHPLLGNIEITDDFGIRRVSKYKIKIHYGIDYRARTPIPVYACASGFVALAKNSPIWGKTIMLKHGGDVETLYLHLSKFVVQEGEFIEKGQLIGYTGATGVITGPHLHLTVRVCKIPVDPRFLMSVL